MSNSRELCCLGSRLRRSDLKMRSMATNNGMSKVITAHFYISQGRITNSDLLPPLIP
jgi:hypothetical protein